MSVFCPCALVPTYNNPDTLRDVICAVREYVRHVIVVNDGSAAPCAQVCGALARDGLAHVVHRARNGGKGAAVKAGIREAQRLGFSHALQVDADGQHSLKDIPHFLRRAAGAPASLVLGAPAFDESAPRSRRFGRLISIFWTHLETGGRQITDPMCGFRVYPVASTARVLARCGDRMDFDNEVAVRMVWQGVPVQNLTTQVRYLGAAEGGVSHFRMVRDNLLISWMHTRMVTERILRLLVGLVWR